MEDIIAHSSMQHGHHLQSLYIRPPPAVPWVSIRTAMVRTILPILIETGRHEMQSDNYSSVGHNVSSRPSILIQSAHLGTFAQ